MQTVSGYTEDVTKTVKNAADQANSVSANITGVNDSISVFKTMAGDTHQRSSKLSELSTKLQTAIRQFRTQK